MKKNFIKISKNAIIKQKKKIFLDSYTIFGKVYIGKKAQYTARTLESDKFPKKGKKFIRMTNMYGNGLKLIRVEVIGPPKSL